MFLSLIQSIVQSSKKNFLLKASENLQKLKNHLRHYDKSYTANHINTQKKLLLKRLS